MFKIVFFFIFIVCLSLFSIPPVWSIPKDVKAKSEYILSKRLFDEGKYNESLKHLINSRTLLNRTNSRIQYLLTKIYYEKEQYAHASNALEQFFNNVHGEEIETNEYHEMVVLVSEIAIKTEQEEKLSHELSEKFEMIKRDIHKVMKKSYQLISSGNKDVYGALSVSTILANNKRNVGINIIEKYSNGNTYSGDLILFGTNKNVKSIEVNKNRIRICCTNKEFTSMDIGKASKKHNCTDIDLLHETEFHSLMRSFKKHFEL